MNPNEKFNLKSNFQISDQDKIENLKKLSLNWLIAVNSQKYSYNFSWLGRPIIQYPQDIIAMQELIWMIKPDLIIETGIAHGGSLLLSASMLALIDYSEAVGTGQTLNLKNSRRRVIGLDIDIRAHNRDAIEKHPLAHKIEMIEGNSTDPAIIQNVHDRVREYERILVCLDSNHTHDHVLAELNAYAPLTSVGSYCVVFDTIIEDMPDGSFPDRPWDKGNNPKTAVWEFLRTHPEFEIDKAMENKLLITVAPDGYLKRVR